MSLTLIAFVASFLAISQSICLASSTPLSVAAEKDRVVVTNGSQRIHLRLADARITVETGNQSLELTASVSQDYWGTATVDEAAGEPEILETNDSVYAKVRFPILAERRRLLNAPYETALVVEVSAQRGIPAVFVVSKAEALTGSHIVSYSWNCGLQYKHQLVFGFAGPERIEANPDGQTSLGYRDYYFLPSQAGGGLLVVSRGKVSLATAGNGFMISPFPTDTILMPGLALDAGFALAEVQNAKQAADLARSIRKHAGSVVERFGKEQRIRTIDYGNPSPNWLTEAEIYNGFYRLNQDYNRENISEWLRRIPMIIGTSNSTKGRLLQRGGIRWIPYVCYSYINTTEPEPLDESYSFNVEKFPDRIAFDAEGNKRRGYSDTQYVTCLHSQGQRQAALSHVKRLMEEGADGIFIDCAGVTYDCYGHMSGKHSHPYPDRTNNDVYEELQEQIYALVKSYGDDKIVIHNSAVVPSHWRFCDAQMLESFIYYSNMDSPQLEWEELKHFGELSLEAARHGKVIMCLPYFNEHPTEKRRKHALHSFAYARVYNMLWADFFTLGHVKHEWFQDDVGVKVIRELYDVRLGRPLAEPKTLGQVIYRTFAKGIAVLNTSKSDVSVSIPMIRHGRLADVCYDRDLTTKSRKLELDLESESGRILLWKDGAFGIAETCAGMIPK